MQPPVQRIDVGAVALEADLSLPERARGLVVFAHASGTARRSPRNRLFARALQQQGLATLVFDLLLPQESTDRGKSFDIELLSRRLEQAVAWIDDHPTLAMLPLALLAAGTGAAAALVVAARLPDRIGAIVSRGGRPDLAGPALARVAAPTLLIVAADDVHALAQNREALGQLHAQAQLSLVGPGADSFEDPGDLDRAAALAARWLIAHLPPVGQVVGR
ncbi:MAG: alpha/beta hydrolase [Burkholderiaceae bacterium]